MSRSRTEMGKQSGEKIRAGKRERDAAGMMKTLEIGKVREGHTGEVAGDVT